MQRKFINIKPPVCAVVNYVAVFQLLKMPPCKTGTTLIYLYIVSDASVPPARGWPCQMSLHLFLSRHSFCLFKSSPLNQCLFHSSTPLSYLSISQVAYFTYWHLQSHFILFILPPLNGTKLSLCFFTYSTTPHTICTCTHAMYLMNYFFSLSNS